MSVPPPNAQRPHTLAAPSTTVSPRLVVRSRSSCILRRCASPQLLTDWRIRCTLYFLKVVIALLAFPFLIFAMPLMQIWLTHVRPTGYDQAGHCVPSLSSSQIKAKFRAAYIAKQNRAQREGIPTAAPLVVQPPRPFCEAARRSARTKPPRERPR